jgi:MFS family permease
MTHSDAGAAGPAADPGMAAGLQAADSSPWAPLRQRVFRWLWLGVLISWIGTWMQTVGAQWLLVDEPNAAALVSLVQAAGTLPMMLLALPGGVLADSFDRRWLQNTVQAYLFVVAILLTVLTLAGLMPPALLLAFTFALGVGAAVQIPAWQAMMPELVPRTQLRAAARLDLVSVNLAYAVGPVLAGLAIAHLGGVPVAFAVKAAAAVLFVIALFFARQQQAASVTRRERFLPALRAGGRYIWHEPIVRRILLRAILFAVPAMALWALLPLIASRRLGLGADGFGALFGAFGLGAIIGAVALGRVRDRLSNNGMLGAAGLLYAVASAVIVLAPGFLPALVTLAFAGLAWMAATSTLAAELQLFLPAWVRARGLAVYTVTFTGSMTAGSVLWGFVAEAVGLRAAFLTAAVLMFAGVIAGLVWRVPETGHLDPQPVVYWPAARLSIDPEADAGPVMVTVEYTITPDKEAAFLEAMGQLRRSRRRTGASRWE